VNPKPTEYDSPLVACDNAIAHYDKEIQQFTEEIDRLERSLAIARNNLATSQESRQQWIDAQRKLQA
jgi:hypothetical protein